MFGPQPYDQVLEQVSYLAGQEADVPNSLLSKYQARRSAMVCQSRLGGWDLTNIMLASRGYGIAR